MTRDEVLLARGTADAFALRKRFHNEATHDRYMPQGEIARAIYDACEQARCEAAGAKAMPGCADNIDAKLVDDARKRGFAEITEMQDAPLADAAGYLLRSLATGREMPAGADNVLNLWRNFLEGKSGENMEALADVVEDQAAFAKLAWKVIDDLGYGEQLGDDPDELDQYE
jgi:cobaltochelatase CobT